MGIPVEKRRYTVTDYLQLERSARERHEYRDGEILLMAGGTADHSLILVNVIGELRNRLKGKPCRAYESNLRIRIARTVLYTYPDISVICGPRQPDPGDPSGETMTNPRLIVEVLSPSTEAYDRGEKFDHYRKLDSLQEYVLVSQSTPRIETFLRQPEGNWLLTPVSGLTSIAKLRSLEVELPLAEVYAGIEFPPREPPLPSPA
ncbi:MAG: Uma2 family endonuclease [Tepidisphaeraceae bacterium]|jgi:Uma2 family endonuclease